MILILNKKIAFNYIGKIRIFILIIFAIAYLNQNTFAETPVYSVFFPSDTILFRDTESEIATDSLIHDFGEVQNKNMEIIKHFRYIGENSVFIKKTWTEDPHYICSYPTEILTPNQTYSFKVCFHLKNRKGVFKKRMGLVLSNGKRIAFTFKGNIVEDSR